MVRTAKTVLFVFNSRRGVLGHAGDMLEGLRSSDSSRCRLRTLACGSRGARKIFSDFTRSLPIDSEFMGRPEFVKEFGSDCSFPAVFLRENGDVRMLLNSGEINGCRSTEELIVLLRLALRPAIGFVESPRI